MRPIIDTLLHLDFIFLSDLNKLSLCLPIHIILLLDCYQLLYLLRDFTHSYILSYPTSPPIHQNFFTHMTLLTNKQDDFPSTAISTCTCILDP